MKSIKNYFFIFLCIIAGSCGKDIKKEYYEIKSNTNESLASLIDSISSLNSYDLTIQFMQLSENYSNSVENLISQEKDHKKNLEILDTLIVKFDQLENYESFVKRLTEKNNYILNKIKDKYWAQISDVTSNYSNDVDTTVLFTIRNSEISFPGYKNKFKLEIDNGIITLLNSNSSINQLFFEPIDSLNLIVRDNKGNIAHFGQPSLYVMLIGSWGSLPHPSQTMINIESDKHVNIKTGYNIAEGELNVKNNVITIPYIDNISMLGQSMQVHNTFNCTYNKSNDIFRLNSITTWLDTKENVGLDFSREQQSGPDNIDYIFNSYNTKKSRFNTNISNSTDISNIDDFLKAYEELMDEYVLYLKKANKGDMSALSESSILMEKINNYTSKLETIKGDLTPSQLSKFQKINEKMIKAASEINN